jgi:hypothetical protein
MAAHPLESKWVFWYDNPKMKKPEESWEENLKRINAFDNVEDFWCLFNNMAAPKKLSLGSNYHLFKEASGILITAFIITRPDFGSLSLGNQTDVGRP